MRVVDQASIVWETLERAAAFVPLINDFLLSSARIERLP